MESFRITTSISDAIQEVLVIPDECTNHSIFHLVKDGSEYCKLIYSDMKQWEIVDYTDINPAEFEAITKRIEEHYF
ncbi:MAG: hypothetical protein H7Y07_08060 [Pyrinomonadaceae bacterium]|nr:hypothetical protein [Sphingobacteriaceae bacterium]